MSPWHNIASLLSAPCILIRMQKSESFQISIFIYPSYPHNLTFLTALISSICIHTSIPILYPSILSHSWARHFVKHWQNMTFISITVFLIMEFKICELLQSRSYVAMQNWIIKLTISYKKLGECKLCMFLKFWKL